MKTITVTVDLTFEVPEFEQNISQQGWNLALNLLQTEERIQDWYMWEDGVTCEDTTAPPPALEPQQDERVECPSCGAEVLKSSLRGMPGVCRQCEETAEDYEDAE